MLDIDKFKEEFKETLDFTYEGYSLEFKVKNIRNLLQMLLLQKRLYIQILNITH